MLETGAGEREFAARPQRFSFIAALNQSPVSDCGGRGADDAGPGRGPGLCGRAFGLLRGVLGPISSALSFLLRVYSGCPRLENPLQDK